MTFNRPTARMCAITLLAAGGALLLLLLAPTALRARGAATYYVGPGGGDWSAGTDPAHPLATIQHAVDLAQPGDTVRLAPGVYLQDVVSRRNGTTDAPITISGPADAIVKGAGVSSRIFEIHHDHLTLDGFTIDGLWAAPTSKQGFREKLLYVAGAAPHDGVAGLRVLHMTLQNAGGECLRMRYFAQHNEVAYSHFAHCGVHDFVFYAGKRNGEAIYIGTAPEQRANGENPTADPDNSNDNWIHHNFFDTQGNECVDIKEASSGNLVEYNRCTGQQDPNSGGFDARGGGNIIRYNESFGNVGAGIRLGGDTAGDGIDNQVYGNDVHDNQAGGIKLLRQPQQLCGNLLRNNRAGDIVGAGKARPDATAACAGQAAQAQPIAAGDRDRAAVAPAAATRRFAPAVDTYISSAAPEQSYGGAAQIKVDQTPETWALLRFELPRDLAGRRALLKLYVQRASSQGGTAYVVPSGWGSTIKWSARPVLGAKVAEIGHAKKGHWITIDVTSAFASGGTVALAIVPQSEHAASYRSLESDPAHAPQLVVE